MPVEKRVGVLTIGQSPRPDLISPLSDLLPGCQIVEEGALDDVAPETIPKPAAADYPLMTKLRSGADVVVGEDFLTPLLESAMNRRANDGLGLWLLACAGPFVTLGGSKPLLKPFWLARDVLRSFGIRRIGVICPVEMQVDGSHRKWSNAGFDAMIWSVPSDLLAEDMPNWLAGQRQGLVNVECIVLDYFGYPLSLAGAVSQAVGLPVLDLGGLSLRILASMMRADT